jgi:hypothetical protein
VDFPGPKKSRFIGEPFRGSLLLATVGLFFLVSATDFLVILIAIELISVSSFVLTGFLREDRRASEAAMKYFMVGAFSAGLMVFGMSLLYGITGGTSLAALTGEGAGTLPALPLVGALFFILAGFGFKLALVPFHMWAPDVYEGAPTPITAFLSVAPKAAAFGMMIRFFQNHTALHVTVLLAVLSAVTMTVGNLAALRQTNVKRLLAYSSVAQMGYVLMGVVAGGSAGTHAVLVYLAAYIFNEPRRLRQRHRCGGRCENRIHRRFFWIGVSLPCLGVNNHCFSSVVDRHPPLGGIHRKIFAFFRHSSNPGSGVVGGGGRCQQRDFFGLLFFHCSTHVFWIDDPAGPGVHYPIRLLACLTLTSTFTLVAGDFSEFTARSR